MDSEDLHTYFRIVLSTFPPGARHIVKQATPDFFKQLLQDIQSGREYSDIANQIIYPEVYERRANPWQNEKSISSYDIEPPPDREKYVFHALAITALVAQTSELHNAARTIEKSDDIQINNLREMIQTSTQETVASSENTARKFHLLHRLENVSNASVALQDFITRMKDVIEEQHPAHVMKIYNDTRPSKETIFTALQGKTDPFKPITGIGGSAGPVGEAQYSDIKSLIKLDEDRTSPMPDTLGNEPGTGGFRHGLPFTSPGTGRRR